MRGADGGPWSRICALPAFWVGLLYDENALEAAWQLVKNWSIPEQQRIRDEVPRLGLKTPAPDGRSFQALAKDVLDIASSGLKARARLNAAGDDESGFLEPLRQIAASGETLADTLLARFHGEWRGSVMPIYDEMSY
jgi:glutamate--cysteine ligase